MFSTINTTNYKIIIKKGAFMIDITNIKAMAIIKDTANALAVVSNNKGASSNLNYIIGGLVVIIIILVGSVLFNKK